MKDLISVIIPFYNSESYILESMQSVSEQTYSSLEIFLVDDGSTDGSNALCEKMCVSDERFQLLRGEHRGVSAARNRGIKAARGKYVFFLDSDDMIHPELLDSLYRLSEESHAVIAGEDYYLGSERPEEGMDLIAKTAGAQNAVYVSNQEVLQSFICGGPIKGFDSIGGKLILCKAARSILFDEALPNGEDTKFIYHLIVNGADAVLLHLPWYYYRKHDNNVHRKRTLEACRSMYQCEKYIRDQEIKNGRLFNAAFWEENFILHHIGEWYKENRKMHDKELKSYLKALAKTERKEMVFQQISRKARVESVLLFYCYPLYCIVHRILCYLEGRNEKCLK